MRNRIHISSEPPPPLRLLPQPARALPLRPGDRLGDVLPSADFNAAASYLADLVESGRRSMHSRLDRCARLLRPGSTVGTFPWGLLRYEHVKYLRTRLTLEGLSAQSVNLTLIALRQTALVAKQHGEMEPADYDAICSVKRVRSESLPRGRMLSPAEKARLFLTCSLDPTPRGRRDAALLALLAGAGLRREECSRLRLDQYNAAEGHLRLRGKGGTEAQLPLPPEAARAITDWVAERGPARGPLLTPVSWSGRVLAGRGLTAQAVYLAVKRLARDAGCEPLSPHDLRRTFISELWDGADASTVKDLARHRQLSTSARYDRRGDRAKAKAIKTICLPYRRPRPKRKPRAARRGRRRRFHKS